jgi:hypothetical protein
MSSSASKDRIVENEGILKTGIHNTILTKLHVTLLSVLNKNYYVIK